MTPMLLQDRLQRGLGVAARRIGSIHEVMRPQGVGPPLARANRVLRLHASFNAEDPTYRKPQRYGRALWWGVFDSADTRGGDYLVGPDATYFVASQQPLLPIQCVRTNRLVTAWRPLGAGGAGASGYGGVRELAGERLIERWPVSILVRGGGGTGTLPGQAGAGSWIVLLPRLPVALRPADLLRDEMDQGYLVEAAEESDLGWRVMARSASI
ncbi:MAG: hypothetical protein ACRYG8_07390 [Janthinobacterium lividum]